MQTLTTPHPARPALVARTDQVSKAETYLHMAPRGRPEWVGDPATATAFVSMREATRMATRLPADVRAYGLPVQGKATERQLH